LENREPSSLGGNEPRTPATGLSDFYLDSNTQHKRNTGDVNFERFRCGAIFLGQGAKCSLPPPQGWGVIFTYEA
jgi:hypothetical protein